SVSISATDSDGDTGNIDSQSVSIANVAPTVTLSAANDLSVAEGSTRTYSYTISDPGQDTVQSVTTSCGVNGTKVAFSDTHTNSSGSFGCTFPDGDAGSSVSASATDADSYTSAPDPHSVTVHNVPPSIAISGNASVNEGSPYSLTLGAVTDPGTDTVSSYTVHWGDGSSDSYGSNGAKTHTYADGPSDHAITIAHVGEAGTVRDR